MRLQPLELGGALGFGDALQGADLHVISARADNPPLGLLQPAPYPVLTQAGDFGLALETVYDLVDFAPDLPVEGGRSAFSCFMRGCAGSKVAESSAI